MSWNGRMKFVMTSCYVNCRTQLSYLWLNFEWSCTKSWLEKVFLVNNYGCESLPNFHSEYIKCLVGEDFVFAIKLGHVFSCHLMVIFRCNWQRLKNHTIYQNFMYKVQHSNHHVKRRNCTVYIPGKSFLIHVALIWMAIHNVLRFWPQTQKLEPLCRKVLFKNFHFCTASSVLVLYPQT